MGTLNRILNRLAAVIGALAAVLLVAGAVARWQSSNYFDRFDDAATVHARLEQLFVGPAVVAALALGVLVLAWIVKPARF